MKRRSSGRRTATSASFLHKPLFIDRPDEPEVIERAIPSLARSVLLGFVERAPIRFVANGHLHQYRATRYRDAAIVWAPSTAFLVNHCFADAERSLGYVVHHLHEDGSHTHEMVRSRALVPNDLAAIKGHGRYAYLKDMPPDAVVEAMARLAIC